MSDLKLEITIRDFQAALKNIQPIDPPNVGGMAAAVDGMSPIMKAVALGAAVAALGYVPVVHYTEVDRGGRLLKATIRVPGFGVVYDATEYLEANPTFVLSPSRMPTRSAATIMAAIIAAGEENKNETKSEADQL